MLLKNPKEIVRIIFSESPQRRSEWGTNLSSEMTDFFNTHWHQWIDLTDRRSTIITALTDTLDHMYLIDVFRAFHLKAAECTCTFFSTWHGTFSRIEHMLGHNTSLSKFKNTEITSSIFSDHKGMKLKIN